MNEIHVIARLAQWLPTGETYELPQTAASRFP